MYTGGNDIVACSFRGGFNHHRSVDLDKPFVCKELMGNRRNLCALDNILLQFPTAQVKITVPQTQFLISISAVGDMEGRGLGTRQNPQFGDIDLDIAGRDLRVGGFAHPHNASCHQHIFASGFFCLGHHRTVGRIVKYQLYNAGTVAQVDKDQLALVSLFIGKTADDNLFAGVCCRNLTAVVGAFHACH